MDGASEAAIFAQWLWATPSTRSGEGSGGGVGPFLLLEEELVGTQLIHNLLVDCRERTLLPSL